MASKTISVTEKIYALLQNMQLPHESFGDTIERLCHNFSADNLLHWFDTSSGWEDMDQTVFDDITDSIQNLQHNFKLGM